MLSGLRYFERHIKSDPNNQGVPKAAFSWGCVDPTLLGTCMLSITEQVLFLRLGVGNYFVLQVNISMTDLCCVLILSVYPFGCHFQILSLIVNNYTVFQFRYKRCSLLNPDLSESTVLPIFWEMSTATFTISLPLRRFEKLVISTCVVLSRDVLSRSNCL